MDIMSNVVYKKGCHDPFESYSWGKKDRTKRDFRSKPTLFRGGVCGRWVNPPFCKMATFFHRSLALSMPIYRNFQSKGVKWRSRKLWKQMVFFFIHTFKKVWKKQKNSRKKFKNPRARSARDFYNFFREFSFFHTFLKV